MPVPAPAPVLFTSEDLAAWLGEDVDETRADMVERVVWGWLAPVLGGPPARPDPISPQLFSWAIELGGIAHENPAGLAGYQLGEERSQFSAERRREILEEVATGGVSPNAVPSPQGNFPCAQPFPDAARSGYYGSSYYGING